MGLGLSRTILVQMRYEGAFALRGLRQDLKAIGQEFDDLRRIAAEGYAMGAQLMAYSTMAAMSLGGIARSYIQLTDPLFKTLAIMSSFGNTLNDETKLLRAAANVAMTYGLSIKEVADALYYGVSTGMEWKDVMGKLLPNAAKLAVLAGEDISKTAYALAIAMGSLGRQLPLQDLTTFTAKMMVVTQKTQAEIKSLAEAFKYALPSVGAFRIPVDEALAALGIIEQAGIRSSMAGTALRNIISRMTGTTTTYTKALAKLGLQLKEVNPLEVGLTQALERLFQAARGQEDVLATMFGQRAAPAILALMNSWDAYISLQQEVQRTTAETLDQMWKVFQTSPGVFLNRLKAVISNIFIQLGRGMFSMPTAFMGFADTLVERFDKLKTGLEGVKNVLNTILNLFGKIVLLPSLLLLSLNILKGTIGWLGGRLEELVLLTQHFNMELARMGGTLGVLARFTQPLAFLPKTLSFMEPQGLFALEEKGLLPSSMIRQLFGLPRQRPLKGTGFEALLAGAPEWENLAPQDIEKLLKPFFGKSGYRKVLKEYLTRQFPAAVQEILGIEDLTGMERHLEAGIKAGLGKVRGIKSLGSFYEEAILGFRRSLGEIGLAPEESEAIREYMETTWHPTKEIEKQLKQAWGSKKYRQTLKESVTREWPLLLQKVLGLENLEGLEPHIKAGLEAGLKKLRGVESLEKVYQEALLGFWRSLGEVSLSPKNIAKIRDYVKIAVEPLAGLAGQLYESAESELYLALEQFAKKPKGLSKQAIAQQAALKAKFPQLGKKLSLEMGKSLERELSFLRLILPPETAEQILGALPEKVPQLPKTALEAFTKRLNTKKKFQDFWVKAVEAPTLEEALKGSEEAWKSLRTYQALQKVFGGKKFAELWKTIAQLPPMEGVEEAYNVYRELSIKFNKPILEIQKFLGSAVTLAQLTGRSVDEAIIAMSTLRGKMELLWGSIKAVLASLITNPLFLLIVGITALLETFQMAVEASALRKRVKEISRELEMTFKEMAVADNKLNESLQKMRDSVAGASNQFAQFVADLETIIPHAKELGEDIDKLTEGFSRKNLASFYTGMIEATRVDLYALADFESELLNLARPQGWLFRAIDYIRNLGGLRPGVAGATEQAKNLANTYQQIAEYAQKMASTPGIPETDREQFEAMMDAAWALAQLLADPETWKKFQAGDVTALKDILDKINEGNKKIQGAAGAISQSVITNARNLADQYQKLFQDVLGCLSDLNDYLIDVAKSRVFQALPPDFQAIVGGYFQGLLRTLVFPMVGAYPQSEEELRPLKEALEENNPLKLVKYIMQGFAIPEAQLPQARKVLGEGLDRLLKEEAVWEDESTDSLKRQSKLWKIQANYAGEAGDVISAYVDYLNSERDRMLKAKPLTLAMTAFTDEARERFFQTETGFNLYTDYLESLSEVSKNWSGYLTKIDDYNKNLLDKWVEGIRKQSQRIDELLGVSETYFDKLAEYFEEQSKSSRSYAQRREAIQSKAAAEEEAAVVKAARAMTEAWAALSSYQISFPEYQTKMLTAWLDLLTQTSQRQRELGRRYQVTPAEELWGKATVMAAQAPTNVYYITVGSNEQAINAINYLSNQALTSSVNKTFGGY